MTSNGDAVRVSGICAPFASFPGPAGASARYFWPSTVLMRLVAPVVVPSRTEPSSTRGPARGPGEPEMKKLKQEAEGGGRGRPVFGGGRRGRCFVEAGLVAPRVAGGRAGPADVGLQVGPRVAQQRGGRGGEPADVL